MLYPAAVIAIVAAVSLSPGACTPANSNLPPATDATMVTPATIPITVLASQTVTGFDEPTELAVQDSAAFADAWKTLHSGIAGNPAPHVDFRTHSVVVVALGHRNTGGYSVRIDRVTRTKIGATVSYTATSPGRGCMTNQLVTSPAVVISVPRVSGTIAFERHDVLGKC